MKKNLCRWSLSVVLSLGFMTSLSQADALSVRLSMGWSNGLISSPASVVPFAGNVTDNVLPRAYPGDVVVRVGSDLPSAPQPATDQILTAFSSPEILAIVLAVSVGTNSYLQTTSNGALPAVALQMAGGSSENLQTTMIILDVRLPTSVGPHAQTSGLQEVGPEVYNPLVSADALPLQGRAPLMPISHARGPVK